MFGSKISSDSLSCDTVIFTGPTGFLRVMSGSPTNFREYGYLQHVFIETPSNTYEPRHEIMVLFVLCKILQTRMRSHPVGLDV